MMASSQPNPKSQCTADTASRGDQQQVNGLEIDPSLEVTEENVPLLQGEPIGKSKQGHGDKSMWSRRAKMPILLLRFGLPGAKTKQSSVSMTSFFSKPKAEQSAVETQLECAVTADPRSVVTADPRSVETADPRSVETADPRSVETADPTSVETADPRSVVTADPRSVVTTDPRSVESVDPRSVVTADPRSVETADPRSVVTADPRSVETADPRSVVTADPKSAVTKEPHARSLLDAVKKEPQCAGMRKPKEELLEPQPADVSAVHVFQGAADTSSSAVFEHTKQKLLTIPETDKEIFLLVQEKAAVLKELERMEELLRNQKAQSDQQVQFLQTELSKKKQAERHTALKVRKLRQALSNERRKKKEIQSLLVKKEELYSKNVALLSKRNKYLETERGCLFSACKEETSKSTKSGTDTTEKSSLEPKEENSCLVAEHIKAVWRIKKMWKQELDNFRSEWEEERSHLQTVHEEETSKLTTMWTETVENKWCQREDEKSRVIAEHQKATSSIKEMWKQDLQKCRSQWEDEESRLITEHLKAEIEKEKRMQEDLERDRVQCEKENSRIEESIRTIMADIEQDTKQRMKYRNELTEKIAQLQNQMPQKKKRQFFGLFVKKKVTPPSSVI